jgi:hypothetical protein
MTLRAGLVTFTLATQVALAGSAIAAATPAPPPKAPAADAAAAPATQPAPGEDDTPLTDEETESLANDAPKEAKAATIPVEEKPAEVVVRQRWTKATYPVWLGDRPLTITRNTAEATLDAEFVAGGDLPADGPSGDDVGPAVREVIRFRYGVTQDLELQLGYGVGSQRLSPPDGAKGAIVGKQFEAGAAYTILPEHLAVSLAVPMYGGSPFALSLTVGVPFRFTIGDRVAIVGGQDLVQISTNKWPNDLAYPERTELLVRDDKVNGALPSGILNIQFGAIVKLKEQLSATGTVRISMVDFKSDDQNATQSLWLGIASTHKMWDFGARLGFAALDQGSSFGLGLSFALRL